MRVVTFGKEPFNNMVAMTASQRIVASDATVVKIQGIIARTQAELVAARAAHAAQIRAAGHAVANGKKPATNALCEAREAAVNLQEILAGLKPELNAAQQLSAQIYTSAKRAEIAELYAKAVESEKHLDAIVRNEIPVVVPDDAPAGFRDGYYWKQKMIDDAKTLTASLRGQAQGIENAITQLNAPNRFSGEDPDPH